LVQYIESHLRHTTVFGEHSGVGEIGDEHLRTRSSVLPTEIVLADNADAIVLLPASPGSFCELGSWVLNKGLCEKMLLLPDRQFENSTGYLALGPYKTAIHQGASLVWTDYSDHNAAVGIVERYLATIEDSVLLRSILRAR
jgi:hypothetical protein